MPSSEFVSSQGASLFGLTALKKCTVKVTRRANATPKLNASTLDIEHKGDRVYEDGLVDNGPQRTGSIVTVDIETFGAAPALGSEITAEGSTCRCMETTGDNNVGELAVNSAMFTSDFFEDEE